MTVNVHLREMTVRSVPFDGPHTFTTVVVADAHGNDVTLFVNEETWPIAVSLAEALRAAALAHMPAEQKDEVPA
jgi:hypothetical protein